MTIPEDMNPAEAANYVLRRFRGHVPEVLQELYFMAVKERKIASLKEAKKSLKEQERVDAPQVAAKRWRATELQHDGWEIRLRDWRYFWVQCVLFCRNVQDWDKGEQSRLLSLLPDAWVKRVMKEEAKRAKINHTDKMMLNKEHHKKVVNWTKANAARDFKGQSLRNALLITVSGDPEKAAIRKPDQCAVGGQTICLQAFPVRMSCDKVLEWVGEEMFKEYKNLAGNRRLQGDNRGIHHVGAVSHGEAVMDPGEAQVADVWTMMRTCTNQLRLTSASSWPKACKREATEEAESPFKRVGRRGRRSSPAELVIHYCPLKSSSELTLRAALSATGRILSCNRITGRARPRRPTRRPLRRRRGPRSVHQPTSGMPRWKCPRKSSPSG